MTERKEPAPAPAPTPAPAETPKAVAKSANADLAAQISGTNTGMIWLELEDLDDDAAEQLAQGDPPIKAERDVVRQLWAVTLAPTT